MGGQEDLQAQPADPLDIGAVEDQGRPAARLHVRQEGGDGGEVERSRELDGFKRFNGHRIAQNSSQPASSVSGLRAADEPVLFIAGAV